MEKRAEDTGRNKGLLVPVHGRSACAVGRRWGWGRRAVAGREQRSMACEQSSVPAADAAACCRLLSSEQPLSILCAAKLEASQHHFAASDAARAQPHELSLFPC